MPAELYKDCVLSQRFEPELGGSITWLKEVYRRWPEKVSLLTHNYNGKDQSATESVGSLEVHRSSILMNDWGLDSVDSLSKYLRMYRAVKSELKQKSKLKIHCTHILPEVLAVLPLKFLNSDKIKIISYAHGEEILACKSSRQLSFLYQYCLARTDLLIANSENTLQLVSSLGKPKNSVVIHPGVDYSAFSGSSERGKQWRRNAGFSDSDILLLTVGRLCKRKNQAAVIEALAKITSENPNIRYLVLGDGEEKQSLKSQAENLRLSDQVRFFSGDEEDLKLDLYGACDIFIMPAKSVGADMEGFGISFIEAAACGKPAIAGADGGQPEAVLDQQTGLIVDGNNLDTVSEAILSLANDNNLRAKLGDAARDRAKSLDWSEVLKKTLAASERI